jgi:hypothetical protein
VTIPKAIADRYGIREGDELDFVPAGDVIRVIPGGRGAQPIPTAERLRLFDAATSGSAACQLSWFDAHVWAYAEHYGLEELVSEDFQHDRIYGTVRVRNPFLGDGAELSRPSG